jgi:hypothetical protein
LKKYKSKDESQDENLGRETISVSTDFTSEPEQIVLNMPPQYPRRDVLDQVTDALISSPNSKTRPLNLIGVWRSDVDRPSRSLVPEIPGRLTEDEDDGKKIVFKNKLFRRKKHVDWDRFVRPSTCYGDTSMAFLWNMNSPSGDWT